jgi:hypothetical protein
MELPPSQCFYACKLPFMLSLPKSKQAQKNVSNGELQARPLSPAPPPTLFLQQLRTVIVIIVGMHP